MQRRTTLDYALLGLLAAEPRSGYDLRKVFAATPMAHYSDSPGSIYPALKRLERRRWAAGARDRGSRRKRRSLAITPAGRAALMEWLNRPVTRELVVWGMDELMLRFGFLPRAAAARFLKSFRDQVARYARELVRYHASAARAMPLTGCLALQCGIASYQTLARWAAVSMRRLT